VAKIRALFQNHDLRQKKKEKRREKYGILKKHEEIK
jgi:hypothetical protein